MILSSRFLYALYLISSLLVSISNGQCEDSTRKFIVHNKDQDCEWAAKHQTKKRCAKGNGAVATHCPKTCGKCETQRCINAKKRFYLKNDTLRSCKWVSSRNTESRCKKIGDKYTCRASCGLCGGAWVQLGNDINGDGKAHYFGNALALSGDGNTIAIASDSWNGYVKVFRYSDGNGTWEPLGSAFSVYKSSVALSKDGNTLAIDHSPGGSNTPIPGLLRVYSYDDGWVQLGSDINFSDEWGGDWDRVTSLSLSDDGSIVAFSVTNNYYYVYVGDDSVMVYSYDSGNKSWDQLGNTISKLGDDLSISGDGNRLAVSSHGEYSFSGNAGVYEYTNNEWIQLGEDLVTSSTQDALGKWTVSLAVDGKTVAVGYEDKGRVIVYKYYEDNKEWVQMGSDIVGKVDEYEGHSLSLSSDGMRLAIGFPTQSGKGKAAVYEYSMDDDIWYNISGFILHYQKNSDESLGQVVSLSADGHRVAISAPEKDLSEWNTGGTFVYSEQSMD